MTSWSVTGTAMSSSAVFVSSTQVICTLPDPAASFVIQVGFTGFLSTTEIFILNYDNICFTCGFSNNLCTRTVSSTFTITIVDEFT